MELNNFLQAILDFDKGLVKFKKGNIRAFLWGGKWYPLNAVVNYALRLQKKPGNLTTESAQTAILLCVDFIKVRDIIFRREEPLSLTIDELKDEIYLLSKYIKLLV